MRANESEASRLEHRLANLVNEAYQLTPEEIDLAFGRRRRRGCRSRGENHPNLARLLPIKQRLAAVDRLIDRAVYLLYGLTEDEIAYLVEAKM